MCIFTSLLISEMMSDGEGQLLTLLTVHKMITVKMVFLLGKVIWEGQLSPYAVAKCLLLRV